MAAYIDILWSRRGRDALRKASLYPSLIIVSALKGSGTFKPYKIE